MSAAYKVFERRLDAYEKLLELLSSGAELAEQAISNENLTPEERHALASVAIYEIAEHGEANLLYINQDLGGHCMAVFMGVEDIHDAPEAEKEQLMKEYRAFLNDARSMIVEESGVGKVNRLFHSINRAKLKGPFIKRIEEIRREQRKRHP